MHVHQLGTNLAKRQQHDSNSPRLLQPSSVQRTRVCLPRSQRLLAQIMEPAIAPFELLDSGWEVGDCGSRSTAGMRHRHTACRSESVSTPCNEAPLKCTHWPQAWAHT